MTGRGELRALLHQHREQRNADAVTIGCSCSWCPIGTQSGGPLLRQWETHLAGVLLDALGVEEDPAPAEEIDPGQAFDDHADQALGLVGPRCYMCLLNHAAPDEPCTACETEFFAFVVERERRLEAVETHVRESTDTGPDFCRGCSEAIGDWVPWPCGGVPARPSLPAPLPNPVRPGTRGTP